jgi:hypothetical protein
MVSSQHFVQISALKYEILNSNGSMPENVRTWMEHKISWYEQPDLENGQLDFHYETKP